MPGNLFKLAATTPTITLNDSAYYYKASSAISIAANAHLDLSKTKWQDGSGVAVSTAGFAQNKNGYYNLFINGVLQQSILFSVSSALVRLLNPTAAKYVIPISAPFALGLAAGSLAPAEIVIP